MKETYARRARVESVSREIPSAAQLRALIAARLEDARRSLREARAAAPPADAQRAEFERIMAALDELERRARALFGGEE